MNFAHGGGWGTGSCASEGFGHMGMGGFGGSIFGWILMILFAALIVTGIVYLIKKLRNNSDPTRSNNNYDQLKYRQKEEDSAVKIASERYAKGEINKEEFQEIKKNLE